MEATYSVYKLIDPRTQEIRYIGMSQNLDQRLAGHISQRDRNQEKVSWLRELRELGLSPIMEVIESKPTRKEAREREDYWMNYYFSQGLPILNISGVNGKPFTKKRDRSTLVIISAPRDELLTPRHVAEQTGLSLEEVRRQLRTGEMPGFKLSSVSWRVRQSQLVEYMAYDNSHCK